MAEPQTIMNFKGLNKRIDPADLPPEMSPDLSNCGAYRGIQGQLGPRAGRSLAFPQAFSGRVNGIIPWFPSWGNFWLVAQDDGSQVTLDVLSAPFQGAPGGGGAAWSSGFAGGGASACGSAAASINVSWDLSGTSGALTIVFVTPYGNFTLSTTEADATTPKTSTLGCLTFTYSGASRGIRGLLTIKGVAVKGTYSGTATITGSIVSTSNSVVLASIHYTSAGEGYANTALSFGQAIAPLTVTNSPVTFDP